MSDTEGRAMGKVRTIADGDLVIDACPSCGGANYEGGSIEVVSGTCFQRCHCHDCGYDWNDVYLLVQQEPREG